MVRRFLMEEGEEEEEGGGGREEVHIVGESLILRSLAWAGGFAGKSVLK